MVQLPSKKQNVMTSCQLANSIIPLMINLPHSQELMANCCALPFGCCQLSTSLISTQKTSASRAVYELVIHSDYIGNIWRSQSPSGISLWYLRLDRWKMFEAANHLSRWGDLYTVYIYIYDIICVSMINSTTYGNERDLDPKTVGAFYDTKKPVLQKRLVYRVRNVSNEAMSGCSEQNSAETKKSRVANYWLLSNVVEGSQMPLVYNGTVHHGIEGICAGISDTKDSQRDFNSCSELWSVCKS